MEELTAFIQQMNNDLISLEVQKREENDFWAFCGEESVAIKYWTTQKIKDLINSSSKILEKIELIAKEKEESKGMKDKIEKLSEEFIEVKKDIQRKCDNSIIKEVKILRRCTQIKMKVTEIEKFIDDINKDDAKNIEFFLVSIILKY